MSSEQIEMISFIASGLGWEDYCAEKAITNTEERAKIRQFFLAKTLRKIDAPRISL